MLDLIIGGLLLGAGYVGYKSKEKIDEFKEEFDRNYQRILKEQAMKKARKECDEHIRTTKD